MHAGADGERERACVRAQTMRTYMYVNMRSRRCVYSHVILRFMMSFMLFEVVFLTLITERFIFQRLSDVSRFFSISAHSSRIFR